MLKKKKSHQFLLFLYLNGARKIRQITEHPKLAFLDPGTHRPGALNQNFILEVQIKGVQSLILLEF